MDVLKIIFIKLKIIIFIIFPLHLISRITFFITRIENDFIKTLLIDLFLKLFTELPYSEIKKLSSLKGSEINEAKIILANEVTSLCHDKVSAEKAMKTAKETFNQKNIGSELPSYQVSFSNSKSITLIDALCISNLCQSKSAARRLIRGGGAKINNQPFLNENHIIHIEDFGANKSMKLSSGKKNHAVLYL